MAIVDFECMQVPVVELCAVEMFVVAVCDERSDLGMDEVNTCRRVIIRRGATIMMLVEVGYAGFSRSA